MLQWLAQCMQRFASRPTNTGQLGEQLAAQHLKKAGYTHIETNITSRFGEIDIYARDPDGKTHVIVEVKTIDRANPAYPPELRVNRTKQQKLITLSIQLVRQRKLAGPIRFDVIAVENPTAPSPVIRHHKAAFQTKL